VYDEKFFEDTIEINSDDMEMLKKIHDSLMEMKSIKTKILKKVKCKRCGWCCRTCSTMILPDDIKKLCKHLKCSREELYEKYANKDAKIPYLKSPCPFIDDDNRCVVYHARPGICKEFPFNEFSLIIDPCLAGKEILGIIEEVTGPINCKDHKNNDDDAKIQEAYAEREDFIKYMINKDCQEGSQADNQDSSRTLSIVLHKEQLVIILKLLKERDKLKK